MKKTGKIMRFDNYHIIEEMTDKIEETDKVILSRPYLLNNGNDSYEKSLSYIKKKTKI